MKRGILWLACLAVTVAIVTAIGCGGPSQPSTQTPKATPEAKPPAPTPAPAETPAAPAPTPAAPAPTETSKVVPQAAAPKPSAKVTIYRDTWGVPHIYAENEGDAAFGLGYAMAEDRLEDICRNVRTAIGTMAEVFGKEYAERDYIIKLMKNAEFCEKFWPTAPEYLRALGDGFFNGVKAYVAEHPEKLPEWAPEFHGWQAAAIGRTMILQWPVGTVMDDLEKKNDAPPFGSNAWAVAPARSAEKCPILLTDPHLGWEGMQVFYEACVFGGALAVDGFFIVGSPAVALGHNANVGWACTTGGPDTSDCYMLKLNPDNPMQYEYDGQWMTAEVYEIEVAVKGEPPMKKMAADTIWGPLFAEPDLEKHVAYVGASPYFNQEAAQGLFEQMYKMSLAKNCDEFRQALGMNFFMEQNLSFADTEGNIEYVRTGRTPIRPEGYNWSVPVPGNKSAAKWLGIHSIDDLVQIKNPEQGYFQNCNVSPAVMMKNSPLKPENYKDYIWNVSWDKQSPRGQRVLDLLDADDSVTKEEAMAVATNVYDLLGEAWQKALKKAVDSAGAKMVKEDPLLAKAVDDILAWNREYTPDAKGAPIVEAWRLKADEAVDVAAVVQGKDLSAEDQKKLLELLAQTAADLDKRFGPLADLTWGTIHKVGRGGKLFPAPGADYGKGKDKIDFTETVFDVRSKADEQGLQIANNGSMSVMLMFMYPSGVESFSITPWGQNADPASPHYMDQGEKLYSTRTFKPSWFKKEDLLKNVESEKVIE